MSKKLKYNKNYLYLSTYIFQKIDKNGNYKYFHLYTNIRHSNNLYNIQIHLTKKSNIIYLYV